MFCNYFSGVKFIFLMGSIKKLYKFYLNFFFYKKEVGSADPPPTKLPPPLVA